MVHGDKRGRELGWPTANVELGTYQRPAYGIYAVRVRLDDGSEHDGVANLGVRPMFDPPKELLEAVLFDWDGDLYGRTIEVALHHYIRPEMKFDGLEALKAQMDRDAAEARLAASARSPRTEVSRSDGGLPSRAQPLRQPAGPTSSPGRSDRFATRAPPR